MSSPKVGIAYLKTIAFIVIFNLNASWYGKKLVDCTNYKRNPYFCTARLVDGTEIWVLSLIMLDYLAIFP